MSMAAEARAGIRPQPIGLAAEKARYGSQTESGVGISIPAPA